eukprot:TRINITY_DN31032_c0_g1_i1.p2 TRINITY_DN31032_c0_g1~~TRINITY_DN31032_c0_g1_i1.p2  ORF type:complete len:127 (+),score=14.32 TRINITY_DN31032_c0_g1_i1:74-454(+)
MGSLCGICKLPLLQKGGQSMPTLAPSEAEVSLTALLSSSPLAPAPPSAAAGFAFEAAPCEEPSTSPRIRRLLEDPHWQIPSPPAPPRYTTAPRRSSETTAAERIQTLLEDPEMRLLSNNTARVVQQ